jgi:hypothetical protein
MEGDWPGLDPVTLLVFQRLFKTPLSLQAAFDDDADCTSLVKALFPDMVDEAVRNLTAAMMVWQSNNVPAFKL